MSAQPMRDSFRREYPELLNFLAGWFPDADFDGLADDEVARAFASRDAPRSINAALADGKRLLGQPDFPWVAIGDCANRHFEGREEAREWLAGVLRTIEATRCGPP